MPLCKDAWPPRGYIFTSRARSVPGRIVLIGQRLRGWFPDEDSEEMSHAGIVDDYPFVWEADYRRGVVRKEMKDLHAVHWWHPPREDELREEDYRRAFSLIHAHAGRKYDWRWILTFGQCQRPQRDICTELVKAYLDGLTQHIGGWAGMHLKRFVPNHIPRFLNEVSAGRGSM